MSRLFNFSRFSELCQTIENDCNFRPGITDQELLSLVYDCSGHSKYHPAKMAIAIQPANFQYPVGKFYLIKQTGTDVMRLPKVTNLYVLIRYDGNYTFHLEEALRINDFRPVNIPYLLLENFLDQECLYLNNRSDKQSRL